MLEEARRLMGSTTIRILDDELKFAIFKTLTKTDITGQGRIRPIAARHFAEKAEQLQNITNLYQSALGSDEAIRAHFSSIKMAEFLEELMDIKEYDIVRPFIRLSEEADAQRLANSHTESIAVEAETPSGLTEDDVDDEF
jgi:hypothetical protein